MNEGLLNNLITQSEEIKYIILTLIQPIQNNKKVDIMSPYKMSKLYTFLTIKFKKH